MMIIIMTIKGKSLGNICFKSPGLQRELGEQGVYHFLSKLFHCRFSSRNSGQNVCNKNLQYKIQTSAAVSNYFLDVKTLF